MIRLADTPLVLATLLFFSFPISIGSASVLMALFLIAFIFTKRYRERWLAIRSNPVPMFCLVLYGVILLGTTYSSAPLKDITLHLNKYSKLLFAALLFSMLSEEHWQRRCMHAFAAAMLFILASTWLNVWFVLPWSKTQVPGWGVSHHVFGDYITQNVMMAFFVLLSLEYARLQQSLAKRAAWLAIALLSAVSITHLTEGRTGFLLLVMALLVFAFSALSKKMRWVMLGGFIVAMAIALTSSQIQTQRFQRALNEAQQSETDNLTSIGHRLYNYKKSLLLIQEKPLAGWGTGSYHTEICRLVEKPEWCEVFQWHPHNQYLFFAVEHGLLGMLAYIALIGAMAYLALRDKNAHSRTLLLGLTGLLIVDSLFNSPLWSSRENHFFTFMLALLAAKSGIALRQSLGHQAKPSSTLVT